MQRFSTIKTFSKSLLFLFFITITIFSLWKTLLVLNTQQATQNKFCIPNKEIINDKGFLTIYFCNSQDCESVLQAFLKNATQAKCAFYKISNNKVLKALKNVSKLELVLDCSLKTNLKLLNQFQSIHCIAKRKGIMHNKFCVLNNDTVITGSFNPSKTLNKDYNALLVVKSKAIARLYNKEFENLKCVAKNKNCDKCLPYNFVNISQANNSKTNAIIEVYFCPEYNCKNALINALKTAKHNITFMTFVFTDKDIALTMISLNVSVKGVLESSQVSKHSVKHLFDMFNISIMLENSSKLLHHKTFIVDESITSVGSYNPTISGYLYNNENLLIIHDNKIAKKFLKEFEHITKLLSVNHS
ncbi:hypothetical protein J7L02_03220 [Candidatus Woesearchaeota archaeon]|nr:hypothetical protein [Candidatus Woesearchaeota archaeon]